MAQLTHAQYDALERAVVRRQRIALFRRGTEYVVIPLALNLRGGREEIETVHPTTGERMTFPIEEVETIQVIEGR